MGLIELLACSAKVLEQEAAALRACHTVRGRWTAEEAEAQQAYKELRQLAAGLRKAKKYHEPNPLGGPAKIFDAIADSVRAGDDLSAAMAHFGVQWAERSNAEVTGRRRLAGDCPS